MDRQCNVLVSAASFLVLLLLSGEIFSTDGAVVKMGQTSRLSDRECKTIAERGGKIVRRQIVGNISCNGSEDCPDGCCRDTAGNNVENGQIVSTLLDGILTEPIGQPTCGNVSVECEPCSDDCSCAPGLVCQAPSFPSNVSLICVSDAAYDEYEDILDGGNLYDHTSFPWNNTEIEEIINGTKEEMTTLEDMFEDMMKLAPQTNCTEWEWEFTWDWDEGGTTPAGTTTPGTLRRRRRCVSSIESLTLTTTELPDPDWSQLKRDTDDEIKSVLLSALYERPISMRRKRRARLRKKRDLQMRESRDVSNSIPLTSSNTGTGTLQVEQNVVEGQADVTTPFTSQQIYSSADNVGELPQPGTMFTDVEEEGLGGNAIVADVPEKNTALINSNGFIDGAENDVSNGQAILEDDTKTSDFKETEGTAELLSEDSEAGSHSARTDASGLDGLLVVEDDTTTTVLPLQATTPMNNGELYSILETESPEIPDKDLMEIFFGHWDQTKGSLYSEVDETDPGTDSRNQEKGSMIIEDDMTTALPWYQYSTPGDAYMAYSTTGGAAGVATLDDDPIQTSNAGVATLDDDPIQTSNAGVATLDDDPIQTSNAIKDGEATVEDDTPQLPEMTENDMESDNTILKFQAHDQESSVLPKSSEELPFHETNYGGEAILQDNPVKRETENDYGRTSGVAVVQDNQITPEQKGSPMNSFSFSENGEPNGHAVLEDDMAEPILQKESLPSGEPTLISEGPAAPLEEPPLYKGASFMGNVATPPLLIQQAPSLLFSIFKFQFSLLNPLYAKVEVSYSQPHIQKELIEPSGNAGIPSDEDNLSNVREGETTGQAVIQDEIAIPEENQQREQSGETNVYSNEENVGPDYPADSQRNFEQLPVRQRRDVDRAALPGEVSPLLGMLRDFSQDFSNSDNSIQNRDSSASSSTDDDDDDEATLQDEPHMIQETAPKEDSSLQTVLAPNRHDTQSEEQPAITNVESSGEAILEDDIAPEKTDTMLNENTAQITSEEETYPTLSNWENPNSVGQAILEEEDIVPPARQPDVLPDRYVAFLFSNQDSVLDPSPGEAILEEETPQADYRNLDGQAILEEDTVPQARQPDILPDRYAALLFNHQDPVPGRFPVEIILEEETPQADYRNSIGQAILEEDTVPTARQPDVLPERYAAILFSDQDPVSVPSPGEAILEEQTPQADYRHTEGQAILEEDTLPPARQPDVLPDRYAAQLSSDQDSVSGPFSAGEAILEAEAALPNLPDGPSSVLGEYDTEPVLTSQVNDKMSGVAALEGDITTPTPLQQTTPSDNNVLSIDNVAYNYDDGHFVIEDDKEILNPQQILRDIAEVIHENSDILSDFNGEMFSLQDDTITSSPSLQSFIPTQQSVTSASGPNEEDAHPYSAVGSENPSYINSVDANSEAYHSDHVPVGDMDFKGIEFTNQESPAQSKTPSGNWKPQFNVDHDFRVVGNDQDDLGHHDYLDMTERVVNEADAAPLWSNDANRFPIVQNDDIGGNMDLTKRDVDDTATGQDGFLTGSDFTPEEVHNQYPGVVDTYLPDPLSSSDDIIADQNAVKDNNRGVLVDTNWDIPQVENDQTNANEGSGVDEGNAHARFQLGASGNIVAATDDTLKFRSQGDAASDNNKFGELQKEDMNNDDPTASLASGIPGTLTDTNIAAEDENHLPKAQTGEDTTERPSTPSLMYMLGLALDHIKQAEKIYKDKPESSAQQYLVRNNNQEQQFLTVPAHSARNSVSLGAVLLISLNVLFYFF
ncbi:uncharacterized protein LOC106159416 [Lingula anatina]|uniref:Uncharacterized protein LOC106159416 n=1 Tax=Lingula anatina TaxID=7574 RepID=A0A1S3HYR4_LINAN|nr:uncharacterized protein LOC106159416 [Lingula anatina]|eukprot:XP_013391148.1 uncharacterized protein LOC106159416 [Lingula anatina]